MDGQDERCAVCAHSRSCIVCRAGGEKAHSAIVKRGSARPRQTLYRAGTPREAVTVICEGWAARQIGFSDGRKQSLSLIGPGEFFCPTAPYRTRLPYSVHALTHVAYAMLDRRAVIDTLASDPAVWSEYCGTALAEFDRRDFQAAYLGRGSADERLAGFLLYMHQMLIRRGLVDERGAKFPLGQREIADFVGLTQIHVNRVLGALRRDGIIALDHGHLRILDETRLGEICGELWIELKAHRDGAQGNRLMAPPTAELPVARPKRVAIAG